MAELTQIVISDFLKGLRGKEINLNEIMKELQIAPEGKAHLRMIMSRLGTDRLVKPSGKRDGWFKVLKEIKPVKWWLADEDSYFDLRYPLSHDDESTFGLEEMVELSPGDLVVISGVSNSGKSCLALNLLGENVDIHKCVLMGNEYTSLDGHPSPKFKRRMNKMLWVNWMNGNGEPKFDLLPVREDFEDHVVAGALNIIDWINLTDNFFQIGRILEDIKTAIGDGLAVVVLQKEETKDLGRGAGFTRDLADLYITIDPFGDYQGRLTIGKVKSPKGKSTGRSFAFHIVDKGANFHAIREVVRCHTCYGKGYTGSGQYYKRCETCDTKKFIDK